MNCSIVNFYKFIDLADPRELRYPWRDEARRLGLRGTILLAPEGINCSLAGDKEAIDTFLAFMSSDPRFSDLEPKWSSAEAVPFRRMEVKVKRWIIRFAEGDDPTVDEVLNAPRMTPSEVAAELARNSEDFVVIDTRNDYETEVGAFAGAVRFPIKSFTEFPDAFLSQFDAHKDKRFLFYCTGGVRCEKVVPWALERGFTKSTQLDGGILKYFEENGSAHYEGDCFVFDDRWQVDGALNVPTE